MFKNATLFRYSGSAVLDDNQFTACGPTQEKSSGWVPPRDGELIENVGGQLILRFAIETRKVPADAIRKEVEKQIKHIEYHTGSKPGKKDRSYLKEDAYIRLLPMAFPKRADTLVWLDRDICLIDTASSARRDDVITALVRAGLELHPINTKTAPQAAMVDWLLNHEADVLSAGRACELHSAEGQSVKYSAHSLDGDEIYQHIKEGKLPVSLEMTWQDRVQFTLTEGGALKKISFLDVRPDDSADAFDAEVTLATGELQQLIADLIAALGGEV